LQNYFYIESVLVFRTVVACQNPPTGDAAMLIERFIHLSRWIRSRQQRHRTRCDLRHLDDHLLADIGLDRSTAEREVRKPFWR
jgi:uncharacterized protein YjiS (DUF1127 family)